MEQLCNWIKGRKTSFLQLLELGHSSFLFSSLILIGNYQLGQSSQNDTKLVRKKFPTVYFKLILIFAIILNFAADYHIFLGKFPNLISIQVGSSSRYELINLSAEIQGDCSTI